MGFWIYMMLIDLIIPITMIGFGYRFLKKPPEKPNKIFGYRSRRSMRNSLTWSYAHRVFGKTWLLCGSLLLPISVVRMLFEIGKTTSEIGTVGAVIGAVQLGLLFLSVFTTEIALKKKFDK